MSLEVIYMETRTGLDEEGLEIHGERLAQAIEARRRGAPIAYHQLALSTTVVGDRLQYSTIAVVSIQDEA